MTLKTTPNRNDFIGTSALDTYTYTFKIFAQTDLKLTVAISGVETNLVLTTDFTVTGVGETAGGTIVLVNTSQAWLTAGKLTTGVLLAIRRIRPLTQKTDIRNQGKFFPEIHEDQFDREVMIAQQQQDEIDRSIKVPETVTGFASDLPTPVADQFLKINPAGTGITYDSGTTTGAAIRAAQIALSSGVNTLVVTFTTALASTGYSINPSLTNLTDADPLFLSFNVSAKSTTGFTVDFNNATDSTNYVFEYTATESI